METSQLSIAWEPSIVGPGPRDRVASYQVTARREDGTVCGAWDAGTAVAFDVPSADVPPPPFTVQVVAVAASGLKSPPSAPLHIDVKPSAPSAPQLMPTYAYAYVGAPPPIDDEPTDPDPPTLPTEGHEYFDALIARSDYHKGYSMRPLAGRPKLYPSGHAHAGKPDPYFADQLLKVNQGGYVGNSGNVFSYDPDGDSHPQAQDMCRTSIPAWWSGHALRSAMTDASTSLHITRTDPLELNTGVLVGDEVMHVSSTTQPLDGTGGITIPVTRGTNGTTAVAHSIGDMAKPCRNHLPSGYYFKPPVGTSDGNTYFFTWDFVFTDEYLADPFDYYKAYQFGSTTGSNWLEVQTKLMPGAAYQPPGYNGSVHAGVINLRCYPGSLTSNPDWSATNGLAGDSDSARRIYSNGVIVSAGSDSVYPMTNATGPTTRDGGFLFKAGKRVRMFYYFQQNANDWDHMWVWAADDEQGVVPLIEDLHMSIGNPGSIKDWWVELNTSQQEFTRPWAAYGSPANLPPLVMYHANFVALKNPGATVDDIASLLVAPA
jgi:hypothetical protein